MFKAVEKLAFILPFIRFIDCLNSESNADALSFISPNRSTIASTFSIITFVTSICD